MSLPSILFHCEKWCPTGLGLSARSGYTSVGKVRRLSGRPKGELFVAFFILFFLFFAISGALSAPSVKNVSVRTGFSPKLKENTWTSLNAILENPDGRDIEVMLKLVSEASFFSPKKTVFTENVYLPAKSRINYQAEVMTDSSDSYRVELYEGGRRIAISDNCLNKRVSAESNFVMILSDAEDVSFGSVSQLTSFKDKLFTNFVQAKSAPSNWTIYKQFTAVILLSPNFKKLSSIQYKSLIEYVVSGGTLIFAYPQALLDAVETPLAELFPVHPLHLRKIRDSEGLRSLFPEFRPWSSIPPPASGKPREVYAPFLESIPKDDCAVILKEMEYPLFAYRKYGLGSVRFSAIPLTEDILKQTDIWEKILKLFFAKDCGNSSPVKTVGALDQMTGFIIPSAGEIKKYIFLILITVLIILCVGGYLKKGILAWFFLSLFSILVTLYIFAQAGKMSQGANMIVGSFETFYNSPYISFFDGKYSVFSKTDCKVDIECENRFSVISGIPEKRIMGFANIGKDDTSSGFGGGTVMTEPIEVSKTIAGLSRISGLPVKENSLKQFNVLGSSAKFASPEKYPRIVYFDNSWKFDDWKLSPGMSTDQACLCFQSIFYPLIVKNGILSLRKEGGLWADASALSIFEAVRNENVNFSPYVILIRKADGLKITMEEKVELNAKHITLIPVREKCAGKTVKIPFESVDISYGSASTRILGSNIRNFTIVTQDDTEYLFKFQVPPVFVTMSPKNIEVRLDYVNDGGNIEVTPFLLNENKSVDEKLLTKNSNQKGGKKGVANASIPSKYIAAANVQGHIFVFKDVEGVLDSSGSACVVLRVKIKNQAMSVLQRLTTNQWTLTKFDISVSGELPDGMAETMNY